MNEREEEIIWAKVENMTLREIKQDIVKLNDVIETKQEIINKMEKDGR